VEHSNITTANPAELMAMTLSFTFSSLLVRILGQTAFDRAKNPSRHGPHKHAYEGRAFSDAVIVDAIDAEP
jgi:hypothetical protein